MTKLNFLVAFFVLYCRQLADAWTCDCGYYCNNTELKYLAPVICPVGYYCLKGGYNKTSQPYPCTPGRVCPTPGLCAAQPCPCGYYCPAKSSAPIKCSKNTVCPANSKQPTNCHAGECPYDGMCTKLQKSTTAANIPTTPSTFSTTTAATCPQPTCSDEDTPPGYICLNDPSVGCGLFCVLQDFCPGSSVYVPGTTGTIVTNQIALGTTTSARVYNCGYYVPKGLTIELPCKPGKYCPVPVGSTGTKTTTPITPLPCPAGYFCGGATCLPTPCPCGSKCPVGSSAKTLCRPPYYCPNPLASSQTLCPKGFKCDKPGMCNATACPPGTFVSCEGKKTCDSCPAGRFCESPLSSKLCPVGYYCPAGTSAPSVCPESHYCPLGSAGPQECEDGGYSKAGSKSKKDCGKRR